MAWIKRNLFFVIGGVVAVVLMCFGGYYLFTQISDESKVASDIHQQNEEYKRLNGLKPHPGDDKIDNVKLAREQEAALRAYINKVRAFYQRIPPIPDSGTNKVSNSEFAAQLRNTVALLRHNAEQQSVIISQPDYYFTFESQKKLMLFDPASLDKLAVQLGEVKAICDILFAAKVNSLDSLRRESISTNDNNPADYLVDRTISTALAEMSPYEVTFHGFSTELSIVLASLASSPYGFIVKTVNVDPSASSAADEPNMGMNNSQIQRRPEDGMSPGRHREGFGGPPPGVPSGPPPAARGSPAFLNEKPFRVTLLIEVVKLKPAAK